jgi:hypothetical protein
MSDDGNPGGGTAITSFITKQGDNYYRSVSPTNAMVSIRGVASGTWGINISGTSASSTSTTFVSSPDGGRNPNTDPLPTTNPRALSYNFAGAGFITGATGNYAGVMTYAPWDGTSASTGDSSYQLAFCNWSGVNASGLPGLALRNGINSSWNSTWYQMLHSGNYSSYALPLTGNYTRNGTLYNIGTVSIGQNTNGTAVIDAFSSFAYFGCNSATNGMSIGPSGAATFSSGISVTTVGDFGSFSGNNQGIGIYHSSSYYGRIRFYNDGTNNSTIHAFGTSWVGGSSSGYINIDGANGVNFGAWTGPDVNIARNGTTQFFRLTYAHSSGNTASAAGSGFQAYSPSGSGTGAIMSFHRAGIYAVNFGLDSDNVMRIGGWSASANRWQLDMSGNQTVAGTSTATGFFESSDSRFKQLVQDDYRAIGVQNIKPKLYIKDGKEEVGYFAQDFQSILSSAVSENNEGFLNLSYTQVHTVKIAIIEDEVDILKKRVTELESKLQKYEA